MYQKLMLGLLMMLLVVIGVELARPRPSAPALAEWKPPTASEELLDRNIDDLSLESCTLAEAVDALQKKTGVPIEVDWAKLQKWNDVRVSIELHDAKLGDVIAYLFSYHRSWIKEATIADFGVDNGKLVVAPANILPSGAMSERIYDVRDLLTDEYWGCSPGTLTPDLYNDRAQAICRLLHRGTEIQNWKDTGMGGSRGGHEVDGRGTYSNWGGRLFIMQTDYNHRLVVSALTRLRTGKTGPMSLAPLDRRIDHLELKAMPPVAAIHVIAAKAHASFVLEESDSWPRAALGPPTPINLTLDNVTLESALAAITSLSDDINFNEQGNGIIGTDPGDGVMEAIDASALIKAAREPLAIIDPAKFYGEMPTPTASGRALLSILPCHVPIDYNPYIQGTRIVYQGSISSARQMREAVAALAHPISLSVERKPVVVPPHIADFACENVPPSAALNQLRQAAGSNIIWHLSAPIVDSPDASVSVQLDDVTPAAIARELWWYGDVQDQIILSMQDGVLCVDPADDKTPKICCAYDVSSFMDHYKAWYEQPGIQYDPSPDEKQKADALVSQVQANDLPGYWHGRLLVLGTPWRQRRVFYLLRDLQDGKPLPTEGFQ